MNYSKVQDLRNLFLETNKQAKDGKKLIDEYIGRDYALSKLLRHHSEKTISDEETWLRDDVDYFLEYFSFLSLAHITGYVTLAELQERKDEIEYYLSLKSVNKYYYKHYILELPQVLLEVIEYDEPFALNRRHSSRHEKLFLQFHALNQRIDNDDVNQFLWFLDGGVNDGFDIEDLQEVLGKTNKCFQVRNQKDDDALRQSVRGFFMYLDFLISFEQFLKNVPEKLHKSAYWMYHGYWFKKIRNRLKASIQSFFSGMQEFLSKEKQKASEMEKMKMSEQIYLSALEKIVFTTQYKNYFDTYTEKWRQRNEFKLFFKIVATKGDQRRESKPTKSNFSKLSKTAQKTTAPRAQRSAPNKKTPPQSLPKGTARSERRAKR